LAVLLYEIHDIEPGSFPMKRIIPEFRQPRKQEQEEKAQLSTKNKVLD
jgi:hypothetical protein